MQDYRKLLVWQKSHEMVLEVYRLTKEFPGDERFGLTSQLRRSAASIPTNLAEGCGRGTQKELLQFCRIAMGSATEAGYQAFLACELKYGNVEHLSNLCESIEEVRRMLSALMERIRQTL